MNVKSLASAVRNFVDERLEKGVAVLIVDTQAAFDRNRDVTCCPHGAHTLGNDLWRKHQASTEGSLLYSV